MSYKVDTVRRCDGCTKCCEGYVTAQIYSYQMYPGKSCYFKGKNCCTIYDYRPVDPCKTFNCEWKRGNLPLDWKPSKIGILTTIYSYQGKKFIVIIEAGNKHDPKVIDYYQKLFDEGKIDNFMYVKDGEEIIVSRDFNKL
jgi:hypothetical protein